MTVTQTKMDNGVPPIYYDDTLRITHNPAEAYPELHSPPRLKPGLDEKPAPLAAPASVPLRLDLGAGNRCVPGFVAVDRKTGQEVYPLAYPDASADEIRASHVLEHFSHQDAERALRDWVRVLKPGGRLRVAVPDFKYIAEGYLAGRKEPFGNYVMGAQIDADDFHRTIFDEERLAILMDAAGLQSLRRWTSDNDDCATLPCSLNLEGTKKAPVPIRPLPKVAAIMSMPRLAFSDNMFCCLEACAHLGIEFRRVTGVYWGQCMERVMEEHLADGTEFILTIDYDTCFRPDDIRRLCALVQDHPEIDALAPIQVKREEDAFLLGLLRPDGTPYPPGTQIGLDHFAGELCRASWAHFGCTLIRVSALRDLPHPWFHATPNAEGRWGEGRQDDDTYFWKRWIETGRSLYLANRVPVGHAFLMVAWPSADGGIVYQRTADFANHKDPLSIWQ